MSTVNDDMDAAPKDSVNLLSLPDEVLSNIFYMLDDKADRKPAFLVFP